MVDPYASSPQASSPHASGSVPDPRVGLSDIAERQPGPSPNVLIPYVELDGSAEGLGLPGEMAVEMPVAESVGVENHSADAPVVGVENHQIVLIARARRGEPEAIAALLQRDLTHHGIEVSAWARGTTLRLELMSPFCLTKPEAMAFIHNGMDYLQAEGVDAVQVSAYVQGEYDPRWVERLHLRQRPLPLAGPSGQARRQKLRSLVEGVLGGVVGETAQRLGTQVRGSWAAVAVAASTVLVGAVAIAALSGPDAPDTNPDAEQVVQP